MSDVAAPLGPWVHSPADARLSRLLYRPILDSTDDDARKGQKPGQLAASLESFRAGQAASAASPARFSLVRRFAPVSAIDVARDLIDRTDPHSPRYEARWSELLDRVETTDLTQVEIRLNRPALQPRLWFLGPVGPAHASIDGRVAAVGPDRPLVTDGDYQCVEGQRRTSRAASPRDQANVGERHNR